MGASQSNASVAASSNSSAPAAATGLNAAVRLSSLTDDVESRMASSIKWAAGAFKKMTASSEKKNGASANSLQRRSKRKRWSGEVEDNSGPDRTIQVPDEILAMIFVLVDAETLTTSVPAVCRRWREVCRLGLVKFHVDLSWATVGKGWLGNPLLDETAVSVVKNFAVVTTLDLSWCGMVTDKGLAGVAANCSRLLSLSLKFCRSVTDEGLAAVAGAGGCNKLLEIDLSGLYLITDKGIAAILAGCPDLAALSLARLTSVTDATLKVVASGGGATLQALTVADCEQVTDAGVAVLSDSMEVLAQLDLGGCVQVSDLSVKHLAAGLSELSSLSLRNTRITDTALAHLAGAGAGKWTSFGGAAFRNFNHTDGIGHCAITDDGLNELSSCEKLAALNLEGCSKVTAAGQAQLCAACPTLQVRKQTVSQGAHIMPSLFSFESVLVQQDLSKSVARGGFKLGARFPSKKKRKASGGSRVEGTAGGGKVIAAIVVAGGDGLKRPAEMMPARFERIGAPHMTQPTPRANFIGGSS
eukprot:gene15196-24217_t